MASLSGASPLPRGAATASFGVQRSPFRGAPLAHIGPVAAAAASSSGLAVSRLVSEVCCLSNWKRTGSVVVRCRRLEVQEAEKIAEEEQWRPLKVGIICGGPSAERGISLNSARSVLDHIQGHGMHVSCYYIDTQLNAYAISPAQLYSNTPADFDFKLESLAQGFQSLPEFTEHLSHSVDIAFPVIHGRFGEDGGIQELLERANVPFIGTPSRECRKAFDKYEASRELSRQGFVTVPNFLVKKGELNTFELREWFSSNQLDKDMGKVVVKPARSGSSIGVTVAYGAEDAIRKASNIISEGIDDKVLIEFFLEGGSEFTAIVLDVGTASDRHPVELQFLDSSNPREETIFDYRKKYLPTQQVSYHTPPRFPSSIIQHIREGAALLFKYFGLRDFARIDGWFFPSTPHVLNSSANVKFGKVESGTIIYTDINLISGMEQTSFLFQQASKVGFSHSSILRTIIQHACLRFPSLSFYSNTQSASSRRTSFSQNVKTVSKSGNARKVFVIFGGETSERQVSLMSGTNVWLNLQSFDDLDVTPCLLAPENGYSPCNHDEDEAYGAIPRIVWSLPYYM
ncbi:hypothetical protein Taro_043532 [Colocasia esculenta]|uniref:ATP-grasp domain-containing protein n=1 Tax=Colocasia esculenta TaxID=4460 RepID=A0A843X1P8_COLES|nr:hypothetical protein [Colocasia esculenta]